MFCFFFLDRKSHQKGYDKFGFSVISHVDNEFFQKKIPNYVNKNKENIEVTLKNGQCSISRDTIARKSKKYFEEQLEGIIDKDVYSIPYVDEESINPDLETTCLTIMKTFKKWCSSNNQNKEEMKGLVIYDYSLDNHLEFLKFHRSFSTRRFFSSIFNKLCTIFNKKLYRESNKLILAYNPAEKIIFLIRRANIKNLQTEMKASTIDVMKFVLLHFEILKNSGVRVINLLVTDKTFEYLPLPCETCKHQVISIESLANWLEKKNEKFSISINYENINENFNQDFCAQVLFFLATHGNQREGHFDCMLPSKTDILREQVEEANFLTNKHWQIIYSKRKHQIVFGWYDSGILAVAQKRAELICRELSSNEVLYFICCDSKSQLLTKQKNNPKIKMFWNSNLRNLCEIIKEILEKNKTEQKVHLVAVEYDLEELNNGRSKELEDMLMENDKLKDSYIFLACQPIQKKRILEEMGKAYSMEANFSNYLRTLEENLYYNKTNTLEINTLIYFIALELENVKTVYTFSCNAEPKAKTENHGNNFTELKLKRERKRITFDETLELYNLNKSLVFDEKGSDTVTVKSYFKYFIKPSEPEGNKQLVKPSLVEIEYTEHTEEFMILNLKTILYKIIHQSYRQQKDYDILNFSKQEKHVILHFNIESDFPHYLEIAFNLMGEKERVTNEYKEFIDNEDKTILICNYRTFRVLTNSSVIIVLEPFLYHQKFYVLESLSRASVVLDIIVLNMSHTVETENKETFQSTINKWKDSNKIQSLFSPFEFVVCKKQDGVKGNTSEEDFETIKDILDKSKRNVSCDKTEFSLNLAR